MHLPQSGDLASQLAGAFEMVMAQGFELPIHWIVVGANGELLAGRCDARRSGLGLQSRVLATHSEGGIFATPVNVMLVDSRGEAARVVIQPPSDVLLDS